MGEDAESITIAETGRENRGDSSRIILQSFAASSG
jgi:hypothetical protein